MLDIICESPEDSSTLLIPCMVTKMLTESSVWEEYSPSQKFPPPIVIFPDEVQTIPEGFFFRIVTKFARKYPGARELYRNRSIFKMGDCNLKLELLYYDRGTCLIVSMTGEGDMENAVSSVPKLAPEIREFVAESVEGAKKRGMSGLKLAYYWQVANKGVFESHVDTGKASCRLPRNGSLVTVQLRDRGVCSPGPPDSLYCVSKERDVCVEKEQRELVHRWYKKENRPSSEAGNASDELSPELIEKHLPSVKVEYEKREKNDNWVYDIFLSFSGKGSRVFCRQVHDRLKSAGAKVFFDERSIAGGSDIVQVLLEALGKSKYVAVFLTHEMKGSSHPEAEATVALKVHRARGRLLPLFHTMSPEECQDANISVYLPVLDEKLYQMIAKIVGKNLQKEKEEDKINAAAHFILKSMKFAVEETDTDGGGVKGEH